VVDVLGPKKDLKIIYKLKLYNKNYIKTKIIIGPKKLKLNKIKIMTRG